MTDYGFKVLGAVLVMFVAAFSAIGEALVVVRAIDGMSRNPEAAGKLRTSMIIGCSLVETTAIYSLLVAILIIFVA